MLPSVAGCVVEGTGHGLFAPTAELVVGAELVFDAEVPVDRLPGLDVVPVADVLIPVFDPVLDCVPDVFMLDVVDELVPGMGVTVDAMVVELPIAGSHGNAPVPVAGLVLRGSGVAV